MTLPTHYADASVIAGLTFYEIDPVMVTTAIGADAKLAFSRFGLGEVVSAMAARTRAMGKADGALIDVAALRRYLSFWTEAEFVVSDLDRAIDLCAQVPLALKLPDAIHVAIADRLRVPLLTADRQQARAATTLRLAVELLPILKR